MAVVIITLVYIIRICLQCQQRGADLGDKRKKDEQESREGVGDKKNKTEEELGGKSLSRNLRKSRSHLSGVHCNSNVCLPVLYVGTVFGFCNLAEV